MTPRTDHSPSQSRPGLSRFFREMAVQDWYVLTYLLVLTLAVATSPGEERARCLERALALLLFCAAVLSVVRGGYAKPGIFSALAYRLAVYGTLQLSYFHLREILPLVNARSLDAQLSNVDEHILHFEPSLWLDGFITSATTEWFSFFYFGYFALLAVHVVPLVLFSRRTRLLAEFGLGMILVYATAHTVYMLVPGFGPVRYLAGRFQHELPHGFWFDAVMNAVQSGGAQKDIFPSLHTAGPVYLSLFSFRHRHTTPFRWTWAPVAFFSANIVGATMFLRWHYLIDVVAGVMLAVTAFWVARVVASFEGERRAKLGSAPVWVPFVETSAPFDTCRK